MSSILNDSLKHFPIPAVEDWEVTELLWDLRRRDSGAQSQLFSLGQLWALLCKRREYSIPPLKKITYYRLDFRKTARDGFCKSLFQCLLASIETFQLTLVTTDEMK